MAHAQPQQVEQHRLALRQVLERALFSSAMASFAQPDKLVARYAPLVITAMSCQ